MWFSLHGRMVVGTRANNLFYFFAGGGDVIIWNLAEFLPEIPAPTMITSYRVSSIIQTITSQGTESTFMDVQNSPVNEPKNHPTLKFKANVTVNKHHRLNRGLNLIICFKIW